MSLLSGVSFFFPRLILAPLFDELDESSSGILASLFNNFDAPVSASPSEGLGLVNLGLFRLGSMPLGGVVSLSFRKKTEDHLSEYFKTEIKSLLFCYL